MLVNLYRSAHVLEEKRTETMCECLENCVNDSESVCVMTRKAGGKMPCVLLCARERLCELLEVVRGTPTPKSHLEICKAAELFLVFIYLDRDTKPNPVPSSYFIFSTAFVLQNRAQTTKIKIKINLLRFVDIFHKFFVITDPFL